MNHYPHHIGDFNNATRHLTRVERSLYRDMIELYYDTEQPLNRDVNKIARRVLATTEDERAALELMLEEFFTLEDDGYHNARCDLEISKYQGQIEQASRAGKASAAKRSNKQATTVERPLNDRSGSVDVPLSQPEPEPEPEPVRESADKPAPVSRLISLKTYLTECKAIGVKPVPDDHFIRGYCRDAGIEPDMVALAWLRFREEHTTGTRKAKKYIDWPGTFANSVKDRWYRLWITNEEGPATWTSEGLQARRVADAKAQEREVQHEPA